MNKSIPFETSTICIFTFLLSIGCNNSASDSSFAPTGPDNVVIQTAEQTFTSHFPAELKIYNHENKPTIEFGLFESANDIGWSITAQLSSEQVISKKINFTLGSTDNQPYLSIRSPKEILESATDGSFTASISNGRIAGSVEATPSTLSATFNGSLSITCYNPRGAVDPKEDNGDMLPSDWIIDENFSSPQCQPFKALAL